MSDDISSFSKRLGLEPIEKMIQLKEIDDDLKNSLWNAITTYYLNKLPDHTRLAYTIFAKKFFTELWINFFKIPVDSMNPYPGNIKKDFKKIYYNDLSWHKIYELIEFLPKNNKDEKEEFIKCCNGILARESSGYRFVNGILTPITSPEEIKSIIQSANTPLDSVNTHMKRALELFSDKQNPDPRNSVKESVSAVESLCQKIVGKDNATLGDALNVIGSKEQIHLAKPLRDALNKIYGYTSSSQGIRHALSDEPNLTIDDARFMHISCSAFINYMTIKSSNAGIKLK
jgi:hypothetical protein